MTAHTGSRKVRGPKIWCLPHTAFGKLNQDVRVWQRPDGRDPVEVAQFRAAVMQNAIALYVREFKNGAVLRRTGLAALDQRLDSLDLWDARLNGHENLTMQDIATLITVLPGAMPDPSWISDFLTVAGGDIPPQGWRFPDTFI